MQSILQGGATSISPSKAGSGGVSPKQSPRSTNNMDLRRYTNDTIKSSSANLVGKRTNHMSPLQKK